ncbi:hypothetical protein C1Y63_11220 [Corynebacterium sp. 13CS0277]|uniref:hypothetical protein n=1 Tax=Corynebacterium sp. 13CS0277 TaxID=2071994 RepID=UPI000D02B3E9|nr:hypothetical protein [Corynebacterium sp. 13CS0277]PRQ10497.1 hypothetical protein C1Y63_11220 [Corynebacterium sp. 13CS0277]
MKIRNAAVAGLTAVAVALAPVAAANATEGRLSDAQTVNEGGYTGDFSSDFMAWLKQDKPGSSAWGDRYDADAPVAGDALFGSQKNWSKIPEWANIAYGVTAFGVVGTVIGAIIAFFNQLKNNGTII